MRNWPDTWYPGDKYPLKTNPEYEIEILSSTGAHRWSKYNGQRKPSAGEGPPTESPKELVRIGYVWVRAAPEDPHADTDF